MSRQQVSAEGRADAPDLRNELLGRLGVRVSASDQDVESAHNALVEFLELAPHEVRTWAATQTADIDEAFALLSGPEEDLTSAALLASATNRRPLEADDTYGPDQRYRSPAAAPFAPAAPARGKPRRTQAVWAGLFVLVAAVVFGVYAMGRSDEVPPISGAVSDSATASGGATTTPVDQAKVADLMKKISANPKDIASLQGLGDMYFAAGDYKNASVWEQKILAVDPKNEVALLALGAAHFNLGNADEAKKQWLVAAKLYPNSAEVHYDLGFLYLSQTPPDTAKMTAEWEKVVAIDPNSDIAKTVATHLKSSQSPVPTSSATPSAK